MEHHTRGVRVGTFLVILALAGGFSVAFGDSFSDPTVATHDARTLKLFPTLTFQDVKSRQPGPDILMLDLPFFSYEPGASIVLAPHPKIKFMRLSQVSGNPDVTRATLVFKEPGTFVPRLVGGNLFLELLPPAAVQAPVLAVRPVPSAKTSRPMDAPSGSMPSRPLPESGPAGAVARPALPEIPPAGGLLDQRVSMQFEQEELSEILRALAIKFNLKVVADSGVRGRFSISAQDVPLREVLKNLLLQKNFQYTLKGNELTVISLGQDSGRVARELLFRDLSLKDALQTLSKMMNVNLIIHESVEDKQVNFYVENLNLDELLDLLITTNNLVKKPHNENTFIIMSKEEAKGFGTKEYRTFKLVNAKPAEVISMITGSKSLAEKIDTSNMAVNERINALSCYDTPENLELIAKVIENIDEKLKQAVIEVKLLEVARDSAKSLGIDLKTTSISVNDITRLPTSYPLAAKLDFLESQNKAKTLASPKIRAVHGKKATISIGKIYPVPYYRYEVATNTNIFGNNIQPYKEYRDVKVGIRLDVTPEITRDNEITLDLNVTVDDTEPPNADGQLVRSERSTTTYVRVKDGETVVLGGLIRNQDSTKSNSPAVLNKIPLLRRLLTQNNVSNSESEMIMLVTPHLVNLDRFESVTAANQEVILK
ncbi:MAG: Type II/IV secretion system secretin RcpA/CpaC, associated with Flp pilus assembly [Candidatus Ozemobacter sibiricus]|jgi:type II secretory pathway component GspD/PulD (secretin)|uniref:Type II/IV secretion system secretin RcpA/CpaC, associated with Flp pilus assembly n=1 Tax=Candidatus Ozemobacter sibiricus TaxID=2268124 RepID=A0A367ZRS0_9BACT|nr:MAG: Type II/IV secretion system secretin RcpA/CpaC, associated with Flp pilus assembly [Candidatus Ozemobacter sibiricus]